MRVRNGRSHTPWSRAIAVATLMSTGRCISITPIDPRARRFQPGRQARADLGDPGLPVLAQQEFHRGHRHRTGECVGHERRAVHERARLTSADRLRDRRGAQGRRQGDVAAGECLAHAHDVGADARVVGREQFPGAAEAGGDLVEDQ